MEGAGTGVQEAGDLLDVREIVLQQGAKGWGDGAEVEGFDALFVIEASGDAPDATRLAIVPVIAGLVQDIGQDEQAAGQADGQPEEVDERDEFVFGEVTEGDLQIIFEHGDDFVTLAGQLKIIRRLRSGTYESTVRQGCSP